MVVRVLCCVFGTRHYKMFPYEAVLEQQFCFVANLEHHSKFLILLLVIQLVVCIWQKLVDFT